MPIASRRSISSGRCARRWAGRCRASSATLSPQAAHPTREFIHDTHPDLIVIDAAVAGGDKVLATLGSYGEADVFVVDPLGNIMMRFPAGTSMKDMHKDLSLLLKASTIG